MADKKQFSNTKSIVKVETGIVTLISYRHYLKIVGNNKLWPDMQKESWNIHILNLLPYIEWDRFVILTGAQAEWGLRYCIYMPVWYTKGIYVSFVNCFVVILPHHKNLSLLALTLVQYDCYSITGHPN